MVPCSRLYLLCSLLLSTLLTTTASFDDHLRTIMGHLGTHYNLRKGVPYVQCKTFGETGLLENRECAPANGSEFFGKRYGCNVVFKLKKESIDQYRESYEGVMLQAEEYDRILGGCWTIPERGGAQCEDPDECTATITESVYKRGFAFCCCTTHNCNANVTVKFERTNLTSELDGSGFFGFSLPSPLWMCLGTLGVVLLALVLLLLICRLIRTKRYMRMIKGDRKVFDLQKHEEKPLVRMVNGKVRNNLKEGLILTEMIAEGKMGIVHKGNYNDPDTGKEMTVAVKTIKEQKSFLLEEAAYLMCSNMHDHVVHFLGSNCEPESGVYYVVLEYQEKGCLENYLKRETFSPEEALSFLCSLMDGLSFLHSPSSNKSAIVHRDIKSRNILVRDNRTAAIADFGLAMVCEGNRPYGRQYQVGTHRYMSPELLMGMANLNMDGLKKADVYAASLIIWEILNRTIIDEEDEEQPAQLPYTMEIDQAVAEDESAFNENGGSYRGEFTRKPIEYYLKTIVHRDNKRPFIRPKLKKHPITMGLVNTALDMWDLEVDGRISTACAHSRLHLLKSEVVSLS